MESFGSDSKRVRTTSPGVGKVVECACCRRRAKYGLFRMARTLKESDIRAWILLDGGVAPWLKQLGCEEAEPGGNALEMSPPKSNDK